VLGLTHDRQHRLGHLQQAEYIGLELGADVFLARLLEEAEMAVARVVDQHIDPAEALGRRCNRGLRLLGLGDVEIDGQQPIADRVGPLGADRLGQAFAVARGRDHLVTGLQRRFRDLGAEAAAGAGNEPCLRHVGLPWSVR